MILEEGSLRRAADRLRISQSAITRQIQSSNSIWVGGCWNEHPLGCAPRTADMASRKAAKALVAEYDRMAEVRRLVRGESERLRIGYVASAAQEYLGPALALLRRTYPRPKSKCSIKRPAR